MSTDERLRAARPDDAEARRRAGAVRDSVLARATSGHRRRLLPTRWRAITPLAAVVLAVVAVVLGTGLVTGSESGTTSYDDGPDTYAEQRAGTGQWAADVAAYQEQGAFAVGTTVHVGDREATVRGKVKALYYTSEGVLVGTGRTSSADEDPQTYTLVRPDGSTRAIHIAMADRVPSTSADSPYVAFAAPAGDRGRWRIERYDLRVGRVVDARVITGRFTWGGWVAPPVSASEDHVWALLDAGWTGWDVTTGEVQQVPRPAGLQTPLAAGGGRYLVTGDGNAEQSVRDFLTGRTVRALSVPGTGPADYPGTAEISGDGGSVRYGESFAEYDESGRLVSPHAGGTLLDLATGRTTALPSGSWGWTPGGQALQVRRDARIVCDGTTRRCSSSAERLPAGSIKVGGAYYGT